MYQLIKLSEYSSKHSGEYKTIFLCTIYNTVIYSLPLHNSVDGLMISYYWYEKDEQLGLHSRASIFLHSTDLISNTGNQIFQKLNL